MYEAHKKTKKKLDELAPLILVPPHADFLPIENQNFYPQTRGGFGGEIFLSADKQDADYSYSILKNNCFTGSVYFL